MNGYYNLVVAMLRQNGYQLYRQGNGSHEIWGNGSRNQTVSKNMPSRNMANAIMKQASIKYKF